MQNIKEILKDLGFENKEIEVYLNLTQKGSLSALQLSKNTGIDRTTIYDVLNKMINKGLVSSILENNTTIYKCLAPEKLFLYFKEKHSALERILPALTKLRNPYTEELTCETFHGLEGLKTVLKDLVNSKMPYKVIGMREEYDKALGYFSENGILKVNEANIKETGIFEKGAKFKKVKNGRYKEVEKLSAPTSTIIYANVVIFIIWELPYKAIRVKNEIFRKSHEELFDLLWKKT